MKAFHHCSRTMTLLAITLLPAMTYAHPGHGLGPIGHDLQHMAWNFLGMAVLAAVLLAGDRLLIAALRQVRIRLSRRTKRD